MILEWNIAKRYLRSKRKESFVNFISWFSLIGITLGVAVLIIVMSVMNGFRKEIISNLIGGNGHISIIERGDIISDYNSIINSISSIESIVNISANIQKQALITTQASSFGVLVEGISYDNLQHRDIFYKSLNNEDLSEYKISSNVVVVGNVIARRLNIGINDNITLISAEGYNTVFGSMPRFGSFKVVGILDTGMYQYDSTLVIMPFSRAQEFFNFENNQTQKIDIFINNPQDVEKVKEEIYSLNSTISYVNSWMDSNAYLINALKVERNVMFLILSLVILIATFNIISGLVMLVRSKTKEISILRAIGLSKRSISLVFLFIGLRIGGIGTFLGSIIGILFSLNIESIRSILEKIIGVNLFSEEVYFLSTLPSDIQSFQVILVILMALFFSLISTIYPLLRASNIKIAQGIKYE